MFKYNIFFLLYFISHIISADEKKFKSCENLTKALDLNTGAYNKCLFAKPSKTFTSEDLKSCQRYYLKEIEKLAYVFKNICK